MRKTVEEDLYCDFCDDDFDKTSGRYIVGEFKKCWRCILKDIHEEYKKLG